FYRGYATYFNLYATHFLFTYKKMVPILSVDIITVNTTTRVGTIDIHTAGKSFKDFFISVSGYS
ncbi:MAG: hypothetical protein ACP5T7_07375, partial [bacterium]